MRVVFIGKSHEFSMIPLRALSEYHRVVGMIESAPRKSGPPSSKVASLVSNLKGRFRASRSLRAIAQQAGAQYMYLARENRGELQVFLEKLQPEIICIASLSQLLSKDVLSIPRFGAVNLHPSMLPKYNGPYPWFWQYYAFEKEWGVTVHAVDEGQDTGAVIKQEPFTLETGTDIVDAMRIVGRIGSRLMLEAVDEIEAGVAVFRPQPLHSYPKARIVSRDEKFINWEVWPLERVWHFMRGTYPWLDAVEYPKGTEGAWEIGEIERCQYDDQPGKLYKDAKGHYVAHREGKIRLHRKNSLLDKLKRKLDL